VISIGTLERIDLVMKQEPLPRWDPGTVHPRVLVEAEDAVERWAVVSALKRASINAIGCGGPNRLHSGVCPAVAGGTCSAAQDADVVFYRFDPRLAECREVLLALRRSYPAKPIVVEIPEAEARQLGEVMAGYRLVGMPASSESLVGAITAALAAASGLAPSTLPCADPAGRCT
jgi:hypothetical protein